MPVPTSLSFAETLAMVLDSRIASISKALPGTVVSPHDSKTDKTVKVRPGVHRLVQSEDSYYDDEIEILPVVEVPVLWPQGRGFSLIGALYVGDPVLLVCCDRDYSAWFETGEPSAPDDHRVHSWGSAVAIPGMIHQGYMNDPGDALALASKVSERVDALQQKLDALITNYNKHGHAVASAAAAPITEIEKETLLGALQHVKSDIAKVSS